MNTGRGPSRGRIVAWASWDWGVAAFSTVVGTFIFPPYLTEKVGANLPGGQSASAWLGWSVALAGLVIAVLAPAVGELADTPARRRTALTALSAVLLIVTISMTAIRVDNRYFLAGLVLLSVGGCVYELATVPYNGMMHELSTPQNAGRISGFGWAAGYIGSVVVLASCFLGFMSGKGDRQGLLHIPVADGLNVRATALFAAAWLAVFALPTLLIKPQADPNGPMLRTTQRSNPYRRLWTHVQTLWHEHRNVFHYLLASALFRDGLAATFALTSVVAANVFGLTIGEILLFGIAANVIAGVGAVAGGFADDLLGSKQVIVGSLLCIVLGGIALMCLSGKVAFWVCGLAIATFIGPAQSSARTLMLRMAPEGREAMMFGLYATTGRVVSFVTPALFSAFVMYFHADRAGIAGLVFIIGLGAVTLMSVRVSGRQTDDTPGLIRD